MLMLLAILHSYMKWQVDPRGCAAPMMLPTYIKLLGFDAEQTRFAQKYGLYLYKERGVDEYNEDDLEVWICSGYNPFYDTVFFPEFYHQPANSCLLSGANLTQLRGTPVLFLPGNAGSYRQGRSFASEASRFYQDVLQHDQAKLLGGIRRLDFFLADFNEDFAAFDGQTVLDQAEFVNDALAYILSLYQDPRRKRDMSLPDPTSVILIGHSMGGIVARVALTMTNYQFNSVNTIITMSTPHARPPVSFDSDLVATYKQVNDYWRHSYSQKWANNNPLWHVTQISVAGGGGDSVVPSDYTSLASLVPETHGFTVFTSTMPHVWTGVDHLSIAWCDSFRKALIRSLFDIIDVRRATQTKPRAERMSVFRRTFLTGLEDNAERALPRESPNTLLVFEDKQRSVLKQGERLVLRDLGRGKQTRAHLLPVPKDKGAASQFNLLTNQTLDRPGEKGKLEVLFCSNFPLRTGFSTTKLSHELDYSSGSTTAIRLACKNASEDVIHLPSSTHNSRYPFDEQPPFSYLQYGMEDLNDDQFVAIIDKSDNPSPAFLIAEFSEKSESTKTLNFGPLFVTGLSTRLPPFRPMMTEIKIPNLHSSLLAYRLKIRSKPCAEPAELFTPLVRQYVSDPYESKYFVNVKEADINLHGTAPYMPPRLKGNTPAQGLTLQIWSDPSCNASLQVSLKVDLLGSLGKLAMRYRTLFAAFPLVIVALVLRKQFQIYDDTGSFISFAEGMNVTLRGSFPLMILALTLFSTSMSDGAHPSQQMPLNLLGNTTSLPSSIDYEQNDLLLGSQDTFFWFLIPLFGIISVGVCMALNYFVFLVVKALCANKSLWASKRNYIKEMELKCVFAAPFFPLISCFWCSNLPCNRVQNITTPLPSRSGIVITIISLFFVVTFIPYQLVFVLACFVQLLTCAQASFNARDIVR